MASPFLEEKIEETGTDFLGRQAPLAFKGQPALPTTGAAAVGSPSGPVSPGGTGAPVPASVPALAPPEGTTQPAGLPGGALLGGLAPKLIDVAEMIFGGPEAAGATETPSGSLTTSAPEILRDVQYPDLSSAATQTPSGQFTTSAPDILRDVQFPDFSSAAFSGADLSSAAFSGAEATADAAAVYGATGAEAGAQLAGAAGAALSAVPYVGALVNIGLQASSEKEDMNKAINSGLAAAGPFTYGISTALIPVVDALYSDNPGRALEEGFTNPMGLFGEGHYTAQRRHGAEVAGGGLESLSSVYRQGLESGDPAQVLRALGTGEANNAVRTELWLPSSVAQEMGVPGFARSGDSVRTDWNSLSPEQFQNVLQRMAADPEALNWVTGSGDVPRLPQAQAQQVADSAAYMARTVLALMIQQGQGGGGQTPAQAAPVATPAPETTPLGDVAQQIMGSSGLGGGARAGEEQLYG